MPARMIAQTAPDGETIDPTEIRIAQISTNLPPPNALPRPQAKLPDPVGNSTYDRRPRELAMSNISIDDLNELFAPMVGNPAWLFRVGHGSFLTFEFGEPKLLQTDAIVEGKTTRRQIRVVGQWHVWIYCCAWRISRGQEILARSTSSKKKMADAARFLDGQILSSVSFRRPTATCHFSFDLGGSLETRLDERNPLDQWMVRHNDTVWTLTGKNELIPSNIHDKVL